MAVLSEARAGMQEILRRQSERESSARTYARHFPIVPVRAEGMVVHGADGRTYLDCLSGAGTLALGHNHPVVIEAIRGVLDAGRPLHMLDLATPEKDEFTDALLATMPSGFADRARVQFCGPAGTDAVEAAVKLAMTATGRGGVLAFTGGYHGMTLAALAASGGVAVRTPLAGPALDVTRLPYPYPYRCPLGLGGRLGATASASYLERLLSDPNSGVLPPAAMLLEIVQGEGGVIPAPDDWVRTVRGTAARHDIPFIADEVQTGGGRTGAMWAVEHAGVEPDILVASKAIGGGLPLAVIVYRDDLDVWEPGAHAGTFRGNTMAMAAGAATLRELVRGDLPARAGALGVRMLAGLQRLAAEHPVVGDVRGRGLMLGVELVDPTVPADHLGAHPADGALAARVRDECLARGLIIELGGRNGAVLRLMPPLIITDEQANGVLSRLADALAAVTRDRW